MKKVDVLLIGSGISSLTCALLLAKAGKSVCVLEQHTKPGGFLHCFSRFGFQFDTGAHYVGGMGEGQAFKILLEYLGVYDEDFFVPLSSTDFDIFSFPNFQFAFSNTYEESIASLQKIFPHEKAAIAQYFNLIIKIARRFPTYHFNENYDPLFLDEALTTSLSSFVESITQNTQLQNVFYAYCALHGVAPQDIAIGYHAIVTDSLLSGVVGFKSGGDALAKKFVELIEKNGGQVLTRNCVTELVVKNKLITEVKTSSGEKFSAEWVLSGIHPKALFRMIESEHFSPAFLRRLQNLKETQGFFGIYAKCAKTALQDPPFHPRKNYFFYAKENTQALQALFDRPSEKPGFAFVCRPDRTENLEKDCYPLTFHAPIPMECFENWKKNPYGKRSPEYKAFKEKIAQNVFDLVEQTVPGLRESLLNYEISTPLTTLHFNGSENGSSYGIYHSIDQTGPRALGPRTHISNLLLTGQNCLIPGLLASSISGLRTAGHILGIKPLLKELRLRREKI